MQTHKHLPVVQQHLQVLVGQFCLGNPRGKKHLLPEKQLSIGGLSSTTEFYMTQFHRQNLAALIHTKCIALKCDKQASPTGSCH